VADVRFYHLQRRRLEDALPQLLEKVLERGHRVVVRLSSPERVAALDAHLWTYSPDAFLPHGSAATGDADLQPVWLTDGDDVPNGADVLVLADGAWGEDLGRFAIVCNLFDGNDDEAVRTARERWRAAKDAGHALTYWQQGERGGWEKKA
jgi:DNA polymerase-3 subunit chi